ncbi:LysM peptidoglycan-binding domain-containing protein [Segeticoccus rhizosphaerae]|uniref:LysM peptidoglycan-binding domain-containing protein n=1 Tax=Segeticoccus rhizosphaerae TaxID=1104777 RepID=UPI0010C02BF2|nr:LysM peptidoglycan-binding domain-containing protein [Ornithinicoccus soli]
MRTSTVRARMAGLAATLALLGVVAGLPLVLLAIGATPIPDRVPTLDAVKTALSSPDDGTLALTAITLIGWISWAFLTGSILLEVIARARGIRAPRLPGLRMPQSAASGLVGAALLLFVALPVATPGTAAATSPPAALTAPTGTSVTASTASTDRTVADRAPNAHPTPADQPDQLDRADHGHASDRPTTTHTVQPGETLWSIAHAHLGSGQRYPEIVELNRTVLGDDPGFLRAGATLRLPAPDPDTAHQPEHAPEHPTRTVTVQRGDTLWQIAQDELGDATRYPQIAAASRDTTQPGGAHLSDPDVIDVGWRLTIPGTAPRSEPASHRHAGGARGPDIHQAEPEAPRAATRPDPEPTVTKNAAPPATSATDAGAARRLAAAPAETEATTGATAAATLRDAQDPVPTTQQTLAGTVGQHVPAAPWVLTGFTGGGVLLAGSALLALRRRRHAQSRHRRPGHTVAAPPAQLAPVEKTVTAIGSTAAPTVERMDALLRRLAARQATHGEPLPRLAAVELTDTDVMLHLSAPAGLPAPWQDRHEQLHWACPADLDPDHVHPEPSDAAPYPLLVTLGVSDEGHLWLLNCEQPATIGITGDTTYGRDFARYLAAELALNPWSVGARVDCIGVAGEVVELNPHRVRCHDASAAVATEALADAVAVIDRATAAGLDVPTARGHGAGDDVWPARLLLIDDADHADHDGHDELRQLLDLVQDHPGQTGTAIVLVGDDAQGTDTTIRVTAGGRVTLPAAGLDLIAVGLTSDETRGCAALLAQGEDLDDTEIPVPDEPDGWRSFTNAAGALRDEHTRPRDHARSDDTEDDQEAGSLLDASDQDYLAVAATTTDDLQALAPHVPVQVRDDLEAADPTLDDDVAAWFSDDCPLPRLILLGPVGARTRGDAVAVAKRKPYATELLAYLATRPHGATPAQLADAFGITGGRARTDIKMVRDWLGINPRTGTKHLPNARESAAAKARGIGVYQVEDLLVDADLFRRLRARGEARGAEGLVDLRRAMTLVGGTPFDQLRPGGWSWLSEGDRLDQHMLCAVVDVAHTITTAAIEAGDLPQARSAAELAALAAPHEDIPRLDLVAVAAAEGHHGEADRILRDDVCNRTDDDRAPMELSARTQKIIRNRNWLDPKREAS